MKKPLAAVLVAGLGLTLTGCAPRLGATETCAEVRAIAAAAVSLQSGAGDEARKNAEQIVALADRAPDSMADSLRVLGEFRIEDSKGGDADRKKLDELRTKSEKAGDVIKRACNF